MEVFVKAINAWPFDKSGKFLYWINDIGKRQKDKPLDPEVKTEEMYYTYFS